MFIKSEYEAISTICKTMKDNLIVTSVGNISRIVYNIRGLAPNIFYMLGSMGLSISFGLGLALSQQNKHVVSFVGDGAALMNLNSFILLGRYPLKYTVIIVDNEVYNTTGGQKSNSNGITWNELLKSLGISSIYYCRTINELIEATTRAKELASCSVIVVKVQPFDQKLSRVQITPKDNANNFKYYLRGDK